MDKKNILGLLFFMGLLGVVLSGMVAFQPDPMEPKMAEYDLRGFPALPNERN